MSTLYQHPVIVRLGLAALLVAVTAFASGCSPQQPQEQPPAPQEQPDGSGAAERRVDKYEGEIGHFGKAVAFNGFIFEHQMKVVSLDASLTPTTNDTFGVDSFVLWDSCEPLEPKEKPSPAKCTGTEFSIDRSEGPKDSDLTFYRGTLRLKGYFVVKGCDGPHQGLMGCTLRPANVEAVL